MINKKLNVTDGSYRRILIYGKGPYEPKPATTTVITVLNRMIDKGFVKYRQCGNSREYFPVVKKSEYFSEHLNVLIRDFFSDSKAQFASFFAFETDLSNEELKQIRDLIDKKLSSK